MNKRRPSNKRVALGKNPKINYRRAYYYSVGKSKQIGIVQKQSKLTQAPDSELYEITISE